MQQDQIPSAPTRLYDDKRLLNHDVPADWEPRRSSKMRQRFPVRNQQPLRGLSLIAPVQPSTGIRL